MSLSPSHPRLHTRWPQRRDGGRVLAGGSTEGGAFPLPTLEKAFPLLSLEASSGGNGPLDCQENK